LNSTAPMRSLCSCCVGRHWAGTGTATTAANMIGDLFDAFSTSRDRARSCYPEALMVGLLLVLQVGTLSAHSPGTLLLLLFSFHENDRACHPERSARNARVAKDLLCLILPYLPRTDFLSVRAGRGLCERRVRQLQCASGRRAFRARRRDGI
jgi:hypothetical protein